MTRRTTNALIATLLLLLGVCTMSSLTAQQVQRKATLTPTTSGQIAKHAQIANMNNLDLAPGVTQQNTHTQKLSNVNTGGNGGGMTPNAMWDIQFDWGPVGSMVGVVWTGTEFWMTKWQLATDSVHRYNSAGTYLGSFKITGIGDVRGMTTDGTSVYMANGTSTIRKVNIATQAITATFTVPALAGAQTGVRWITYDASGTGGFWVGNFGTALTKINNPASGTATVNATATIAAATHGLTGMYGAVYDATSPGGPYLWVNNQGDPQGGTSTAVIVQVQLPSGVLTNVQHDVNADYATTAGLAGGITIAQLPGYTQRSLVCVNQGVKFVSYELNFSNTPFVDVLADSIDPTNGLTIWPLAQNGPINFSGKVKNIGTATATGATRGVKVYDGANAVLNTYTGTAVTLAAGQSSTTSYGAFTAPAMDVYTAQLYTNSSADANQGNDTTGATFLVTDSVMARDYASFGVAVGSVGIGGAAANNKRLGQVFPLTNAAQLTSVTGYFTGASVGQTVSMSVYSMFGGLPNALLGTTPIYTITQVDQDSGVVLTLPLTSGNLSLPAGEFFLCVNELGDSTCGIATTPWIYVPGKQLVQWATMPAPVGWTDIGNFGANFKRAFVLRANFGNSCTAPISATTTTTNTTCGASTGTATVNVTAGTGPYTYTWSNSQSNATATGLASGTYTVTINAPGGCTKTVTATVAAAPLSVVISPTNASCGQTNGSATATVTNYTGAATYSWNTGFSGATLNNVGPGTYTVVATSTTGGCVGTQSVNISSTGGATVVATGTNPNCSTGTGTASATATGGAGALTYSWSNGQTGANATNLAAGSYTVFVTDANNCVSTASVTITAPAALVLNATGINPDCANGTGSATANASGGTAPYTFSWSSGAVGSVVTNLAPNTYTVYVLDSKQCVTSSTVTISAPLALTVITSSTGSTGTNGTATATPSGGTAGYTYTWSTVPAQFTQTATNLAPGTYTVTVVDSKGCSQQASVTVADNVSIDPRFLGISEMKAYPNPNNGSFTVDITLNAKDDVSLEIRDLTGKMIQEVTINQTLQVNQNIQLADIVKGVYILSVRTSKGAVHQKMIVE